MGAKQNKEENPEVLLLESQLAELQERLLRERALHKKELNEMRADRDYWQTRFDELSKILVKLQQKK